MPPPLAKYRMRYSDLIGPEPLTLTERPAPWKASDQQEGFDLLAQDILNALLGKTFAVLQRIRSEYPARDLDIYDCAGITLDEVYPNRRGLARLPERLRAFVKARKILVVTVNPQRGSTYGQYEASFNGWGQPIITLYYPEASFSQVQPERLEGRVDTSGLNRFLHSRADTLVHELVHAYDDWASHGRFSDHARTREFYADRNSHEKYLNQPLEINARFYQTVKNISASIKKSWKEYLEDFKWNFSGWKLLPPAERRRLILRLAVVYGKQQPQKAFDISSHVKSLESQLSSRLGTGVNLSYSSYVDGIVVNWIETKDKRERAAVLMAVCRLADIFRKTVLISEPFPAAIFKAAGFVANKGRNKDFRTREQFYRVSKREGVTSPGGLMKAA